MPLVIPSTQSGSGSGDPNVSLPGTGLAVPTGIETILEYNGFYMNVRNVIDRYRITEIGGLDDADIRDAREANPGFHGETPYDAYYGGRTVTLTGRIEAYTLEKLRDMQAALRAAFSDISIERPLIFHTNDYERDYMVYCKKTQPIQMRESQTDMRFFRDFLITLRASNPRIFAYKQKATLIGLGFVDNFAIDSLSKYGME